MFNPEMKSLMDYWYFEYNVHKLYCTSVFGENLDSDDSWHTE